MNETARPGTVHDATGAGTNTGFHAGAGSATPVLDSPSDPPADLPSDPPNTPTAWQRMRLWGIAHAIDDLYQGLVPATVPYFVLDRHYSYVAASGLTLAATLGSSIPQPFIGLAVDRLRLGWLAAAGVATAGIAVGLSGLFHPYWAVWALILLSGLGVSMFHPAAGKSAREDAGDSTLSMSIFAAGGSVGFFLAPVLATPAPESRISSQTSAYGPASPDSPAPSPARATPAAARPPSR